MFGKKIRNVPSCIPKWWETIYRSFYYSTNTYEVIVQKIEGTGWIFQRTVSYTGSRTPQQYERLSVYVNSGLTEGTSSQLGAAPCCPAPLEGLTACLPAEGPLISERLHRHRARHERERGGGSRWGRPAAPGRHLASGAGLAAALGAASSRFPLPRSPGRQVRAGGGAFLRSASSRRRSPPRPARVKL